MLTAAAFVLALGLLIAVHEYGHYRMALACRVKVLRFSIGFGKPLFLWRGRRSATEFVLCAFPLGGYVKMLDQREGPVLEQERHLAFNLQPLRCRVAIVAAGPAANLLLAIFLYACVNWIGMQYPAAILASPEVGSVAARAGLMGGEKVERAGFDGDEAHDIRSFEDLHWLLTQSALEKRDLRLQVTGGSRGDSTDILLKVSEIDVSEVDAELFHKIGIIGPFTRPVMGAIMPGAAAERGGLREGDVVRQIGAIAVVDGQQLRRLIRSSAVGGEPAVALWKISRNGAELNLIVRPEPEKVAGLWVGKIGAYVGTVPDMVVIRYGALEGSWRGVVRSWEVSSMTLRMMGKMLLGEASLKNLSGPMTIADYAGKSASMGVTQYLLFLALISVSLGVLNLMPLPVLDGGHLMYYLWEGVTGKPVSDAWLEHLQRAGVAVLLLMMSIAIYNDINRLFG